jgi:hypothetical protein
MKASTLLRGIHHATGLAGLAMIAAAVWLAWSTGWDRVAIAQGLIASLVGLNFALIWLRQRHDGHQQEIDAEQTLERLASAEQVDDDRPTREARPEAMSRAFLSRRFLPSTVPTGWSAPVNPVGSPLWHVSAGREKVLLTLTLKNDEPEEVRAYILPPHGCKEPVSIERCREILAQLRDVQEWFEVWIRASPRAPTTRVFTALPGGMLIEDRAKPRPPAERRPLSSWMRAVQQRHLPELLPKEWTVPVAHVDHDVWMFDAEGFFVMIGYCIDQERNIKLSVTLVAPEGDHSMGAVEVLGKMRNVREFVPTRIVEPGTTMYLAEVIGGDLPLRAPTTAGPEVLN